MSSKYRQARKVPKRKDQSGRGGQEDLINAWRNGDTTVNLDDYMAQERFVMSATLAATGLGLRGLVYVLGHAMPSWPKNYLWRQVMSSIPTILAGSIIASNTLDAQGMPYHAVTVPALAALAGMHQMIVNQPHMLQNIKNKVLSTMTRTPAEEEKEDMKQQLQSASVHANAESARNNAQMRNAEYAFTPHPSSRGAPPPHLTPQQVYQMERDGEGMNWDVWRRTHGSGKKFKHKKRDR